MATGISIGIGKPFALTPRTGDALAAVDGLARQTNLRAALTGHNVMETSVGRNLQGYLTNEVARINMYASLGLGVCVDLPVTVSGNVATLPVCTVYLAGEPILLHLDNQAQLFDLTGAASGRYALILETWTALVGPSSLGRASEPSNFAGVLDSVNKPSSAGLFPAGNVDARTVVDDTALVSATLITQKFLQRQYRLRVVPERNFVGYASDLMQSSSQELPLATYQPTGDPRLLMALLPESETAQAYDRRYYLTRLATLVRGQGGVTVQQAGLGQAAFTVDAPLPAYLLANRAAHAEQTLALITALAARTAALEVMQQQFSATGKSVPVPPSPTGAALGTPVPLENVSGPDTLHVDPALASRVQMGFSGRVRITASAALTPGTSGTSGLRLLKNGVDTGFAVATPQLAGFDSLHNLTAEISVLAGEYLEIGVFQYGPATVTLQRGALVTLQRIS